MKTKLLMSLSLAGVVCSLCREAVAQSNVYSQNIVGFYSPPGSLVIGQNSPAGLTWVAAGSGDTQPTVQSGNLVFPGLGFPKGNHARIVAGEGPSARLPFGMAVTHGSVFFSFVMKAPDLSGLGPEGGSIAALSPSGATQLTCPTNDYIPMFIRPAPGGYQLGVSKSGFIVIGWSTNVFSSNDTVFVVGSYTFVDGPSNDNVRLWINPSPAAFGASNAPPPTLTVTAGPDAPQLAGFDLLQRPAPFAPAELQVDELRIASNWADVTPPAGFDGHPIYGPYGITFHNLGNSTLTITSNGLSVAHIGPTGEDGVEFNLKELSRTATLQFAPVNLNSNGAGLTFAATGMMNDQPGRPLGRLVLQNNGGNVDLMFDPGPAPVANSFLLEVYNGDVLVNSYHSHASPLELIPFGKISGDVQLSSATAGQANPTVNGFILWDWLFKPAHFSAVNATGDRLRLVALNPIGPLQNLLKVDVTGRNLDSFIVLGWDTGIAPFQPRLRIARAGVNLRLNWDTRSAVLQHAPTVTGPWTQLAEGTNTMVFDPAHDDPVRATPGQGPWTQEYFRVVVDPSVFPADNP